MIQFGAFIFNIGTEGLYARYRNRKVSS